MSETITLGGGCFWCTGAIFLELRGVEKVESGYSGGEVENPTYEQVCSGRTGHAEVIQVTFDPTIISLRDLLIIFFTLHDPTTLNRQGNDVGPQYRSVVFYRDESQKDTTMDVIHQIEEEKIWSNKIVTTVDLFKNFYPAEAYHQQYYEKNREQGYCRVIIEPKVVKLRQLFQEKLRA